MSTISHIENPIALQTIFTVDEISALFNDVTLLSFNMQCMDGYHELCLLLNTYPQSPPQKWLSEKNADHTVILFRFIGLKAIDINGMLHKITSALIIESDPVNKDFYTLSLKNGNNWFRITYEHKIRIANIYPIWYAPPELS